VHPAWEKAVEIQRYSHHLLQIYNLQCHGHTASLMPQSMTMQRLIPRLCVRNRRTIYPLLGTINVSLEIGFTKSSNPPGGSSSTMEFHDRHSYPEEWLCRTYESWLFKWNGWLSSSILSMTISIQSAGDWNDIRPPFYTISPWIRGGHVFVDNADHISQIKFINKSLSINKLLRCRQLTRTSTETWLSTKGFNVKSDQIPAWRRAYMSDLTKVFNFSNVQFPAI
jgi:hypothetical protein